MIFLYQRIKGLVSAPVGSPRCGSHALRIPAALPREAAQPWPGLHLGSSIECWSAWYSMLVASKMASNISNKYTAKPSIFEVLMILTHSWNGFDQKKGPSYCCWVAPSAMRWGLSWPPQSLRVEIPPTWTIPWPWDDLWQLPCHWLCWSGLGLGIPELSVTSTSLQTWPMPRAPKEKLRRDTHGDKGLWLAPVPFPAHGRRVLWPDVVLLASDSLGSRPCCGHNS